MSFVGKLDQFRVVDLLQMISTTGKTGRLRLTRPEGEGIIVFRNGRIIYAASDRARETLGHLLICAGLVSEEQLTQALELQHRSPVEQRLGTILVEQGVLTQEHLEDVVRNQTEAVMTDFLDWKDGFFRFERFEIPDHGEVEVDAAEFLLSTGMRADHLLLHADALGEEEPEGEAAGSRELSAASGVSSSAEEVNSSEGSTRTLKSIMDDFRSPEFAGEITLEILEFARTICRRGALFSVGRNRVNGIGHFGLGGNLARDLPSVRDLAIPLDQPSAIREACERQEPYVGPLESTEWNTYLAEALGGLWPKEVAAVPMVVSGRAMLVFYGDNLPDERPLERVDEIEVLLQEIGLEMETRMVRKRTEQHERIRGESTDDQKPG